LTNDYASLEKTWTSEILKLRRLDLLFNFFSPSLSSFSPLLREHKTKFNIFEGHLEYGWEVGARYLGFPIGG
jgi:hypothetical protein